MVETITGSMPEIEQRPKIMLKGMEPESQVFYKVEIEKRKNKRGSGSYYVVTNIEKMVTNEGWKEVNDIENTNVALNNHVSRESLPDWIG